MEARVETNAADVFGRCLKKDFNCTFRGYFRMRSLHALGNMLWMFSRNLTLDTRDPHSNMSVVLTCWQLLFMYSLF